MQTLSAQDAAFLNVETPSLHMHIASVGIYEGPPVTHDEIAAAIAAKLPLVPRYRQHVRFVPLGLGTPSWADDASFSLDYHLRHSALAPPADEATLCTLVGRVIGLPLDRERPLWEMWVVEGLPDGRWALITKTHHCMVDGVASADLMSVLLDTSPDVAPAEAADWEPEAEPGRVRLAAAALGDGVQASAAAARNLLAAVRDPAHTFREWTHLARGLAAMEPLAHPAPESSLNGPIGANRRWGFARVTLADVKAIRRAFPVTINDVVLAAVANGFRELLLARGEDVEHDVVRTLVPVSVRTEHERGHFDNRVSALFAELPIGIADPVERLQSVHQQMRRLKASGQADAGEAIVALGEYTPPSLVALGERVGARVPQRFLQTVVTNVPGPRQRLYLAGRRLLEILPMVPLGDSVRLGVAIVSYDGALNFGITGDYDTTADMDVLARGIEAGVAELLAVASP